MGTLAERVYQTAKENPPMILFETCPGLSRRAASLSGATNSSKRLAITLGFPVPNHPLDVVRAYRDRMKTHKPIAPRVVKTRRDAGEHRPAAMRSMSSSSRCRSCTSSTADATSAPTIWSSSATRTRLGELPRPIARWCIDKRRVALWMSPGKHGRQIREKYFAQGKPCPVLDQLRPRSAALSRRRQRVALRPLRIRLRGRPSRRALRCDRERALRPADAGARRDRDRGRDASGRDRARRARSANSPATTPAARASSRWCASSASTTATSRSSRWRARWCRPRISRSPSA